MGISWRSQVPTRVVVAPRGGRVARAGGEQAERGRTNVADELVDLGREGQLTIAGEPVEELRHEGLEPMRADVAGGLPQDLYRRGHGGAVEARTAGARAARAAG